MVQERIKTLKDAAPLIAFLFKDHINYKADDLVQKGLDVDKTIEILKQAVYLLNKLDDFSSDNIENSLRSFAKQNEIKLGHFLGTIRFAITAQEISPPLFKSIEILDKDLTLNRLNQAIRILGS